MVVVKYSVIREKTATGQLPVLRLVDFLLWNSSHDVMWNYLVTGYDISCWGLPACSVLQDVMITTSLDVSVIDLNWKCV